MVRVRSAVSAEEVEQAAKHKLYVEGSEDSIDPRVIESILPSKIRIYPLGPAYYLRSVAEALYKHYPYYYFIIDRDHLDMTFVDNCWRKFPDPETHNLLVWHKREIENYFIIPEYISKSQYFNVSYDELETYILECCRERLFFDAANLVIIELRERFKRKWIELFDKPQDYDTRDKAIDSLCNAREFRNFRALTARNTRSAYIENLFNRMCDRLAGGNDNLEYGCGEWLEMIKGSRILPTIVNHCFRVTDAQGRALQGPVKVKEIVKSLVRLPLEDQPDDFQELHRLISARIEQI